MVGQQYSENLEDQPCPEGSSAEHDDMNCIALSRSADQTEDYVQQAELALELVPLKSLQRRQMEVSSDAW